MIFFLRKNAAYFGFSLSFAHVLAHFFPPDVLGGSQRFSEVRTNQGRPLSLCFPRRACVRHLEPGLRDQRALYPEVRGDRASLTAPPNLRNPQVGCGSVRAWGGSTMPTFPSFYSIPNFHLFRKMADHSMSAASHPHDKMFHVFS